VKPFLSGLSDGFLAFVLWPLVVIILAIGLVIIAIGVASCALAAPYFICQHLREIRAQAANAGREDS